MGRLGDAWKIAATAPAVAGHANADVLERLANVLRTRPRQLTLQAGVTSRNKRGSIAGLPDSEVADRLTATFTKS